MISGSLTFALFKMQLEIYCQIQIHVNCGIQLDTLCYIEILLKLSLSPIKQIMCFVQ